MKDIYLGNYVQSWETAYFVTCGKFPSGGRRVPGLNLVGCKGGI